MLVHICEICEMSYSGIRCPHCSPSPEAVADAMSQRYKADAGKTRPALISIGFQRALRIVQATTDYGALKYEAHSWRNVPGAKGRYLEAAERHRQDRLLVQTDEEFDCLSTLDIESGLPHIAHEVFCLLAIMELELAEHPEYDLEDICRFNAPPTSHKK